MRKIVDSLTELVGETPLLRLNKYGRLMGLEANIIAKLEALNPGGSVKDRVGLAMIDDAERRGVLAPGGTIIEPTSGNTGIGIAWVAASRGYHVILTMPETMSVERRKLLAAYGAHIELTPGKEGMKGAIERAEQLRAEIPGSTILSQFSNPANPRIHELTTGPEIWIGTDGHIDYFVAGVGTGGTISGVGRYLKMCNPEIRIVAVEPAASPVLEGGKPGPHPIQGIGANFIPDNYDPSVVDEIIAVTGDDATDATRVLAQTEGYLAGISAGAALFAASQIAMRPEARGRNIVALLPDTGDRYLSTGLFA